jgi:hypothetical protein
MADALTFDRALDLAERALATAQDALSVAREVSAARSAEERKNVAPAPAEAPSCRFCGKPALRDFGMGIVICEACNNDQAPRLGRNGEVT